MAINFPSSPVNNQSYTENNQTWVYNSTYTAWFVSANTIPGNISITGDLLVTGNTTIGNALSGIESTLTVDGSNVFAVNVQTFTTSGTWSKPTGFGANSRVFIQAWGAGGSGGRHSTGSTAGGGGGGGYNFIWEPLSALGATETATVGQGGASRTGSNQAGAAGGNSSLGSHLTAYGGAGGTITAGQGGGGGGQHSAGSGSTAGRPYIMGGTRFNYNSVDPTISTITNYYQGDIQSSDTLNLVDSYMHGGGGGSPIRGANTVWGGGGGGGNNALGGISTYGGNGGAGALTGSAGVGVAGSEPGGGGGTGTVTSGAGANGRIIVTVFAG